MDSQKQQVVERLKQANNILVTVSSNPSVDQLAACMGVTLALNKMGKHATAVFSGEVPSTIEFLQPEKTIEKDTNSLQDFIIALDKSKADKLRYKVEDRVVKIFITPYRTSIGPKDLEFSQGDFNVDVVLALGVHLQSDLDHAITSHGRILHDATVISMNVAPGAELGSLNWLDGGASSLSELGVQLIDALDQQLIDGQIATAFLTGIVAETDRFSNQKTSPQTMSLSAQLMAAGANQQLVATKLEEPAPQPAPLPIAEKQTTGPSQSQPKAKALPPPPPKDDGTIEIEHDETQKPTPEPKEPDSSLAPQIHIDEQGQLQPLPGEMTPPLVAPKITKPEFPELPEIPPVRPTPTIKKDHVSSSRLMTEPPTFETPPITANLVPESEDTPSTDPLAPPSSIGLLSKEPLPSQHQQEPPSSTPGSMFSPGPMPTPMPVGPMPSMMPPTQMPPMPQQPFAQPAPNPMTAMPPLPPQPAPDLAHTAAPWTPPAPVQTATTPATGKTLTDIERDVNSPHLASTDATSATPAAADESHPSVNDARSLVEDAINNSPNAGDALGPIEALNANRLGGDSLHPPQSAPAAPQAQPAMMPPSQAFQPNPVAPQPVQQSPGLPPNVPPPMMPNPPSFPGQ